MPLTAEDVVAAKQRSRQGARNDHGAALSDRVPRAAHHAGTGYFATAGLRRKRVVGTIYEDQILNMALQGKDLRKLIIREVMSDPLPQVPCEAPVERVTHLLSHEDAGGVSW